MKRIISYLVVLAIILSTNLVSFSVNAGGDENTDRIVCQATLEDNFADDCVLVVIDAEHSEINKEFRLEDFPGVDITEIRDLSYITGDPYSNPYLNTVGFKQILKLTLKNSGKEEVLEQIKNLERLDFIYSAEPDYYFGVDDEFCNIEDEGGDNIAESEKNGVQNDINSAALTSSVPNDPRYPEQWGLNYINAPQAWDITTGNSASTPMSERVMVGVIDSGVADNPDIEGNVYWDIAKDCFHGTFGKNAVTDDQTGHGTHVAGIIGAKGNNGIGVTGVCWNVAIVPLQVTDPQLTEDNYINSAIFEAINYSINKRIPIINCSFGGYSSISYYTDAFEKYKGLIVCGAGNDKEDIDTNPFTPAGLPYNNIISVAATKKEDYELADENDWGMYEKDGIIHKNGSNFGVNSVDIAAPGTEILSTVTTAVDPSGYESFNGTSMATPFVAGVAALILSVRPGLPGEHLRELILRYADGMSELNGKVANGAFLNAYAAVNGALNDTVRVEFNANGGSSEYPYRYYVKGMQYKELSDAARTGCTFVDWYLGNDKVTADSYVPSNKDKIYLYARWSANVKFTADGNTVHEETVSFGKSKDFIAEYKSTKTGYKFSGWELDGKNYKYGDSITISHNSVITARWEEIYCIITYNTRYFDDIPSQKIMYSNAKYSIKVPSLAYPNIGAYIFKGWKISGGDGTVYLPENGGFLPAFKNYTLEDTAVRRGKSVLNYDANGGENAPESQLIYYDGESITITSDIPVRAGYTFLGWSFEADGEAELFPGMKYFSPETKTVYACWVKDTYVIRFDIGDDADGVPASMAYAAGGITLPTEVPTREGYTFAGWSYTGGSRPVTYERGARFKVSSSESLNADGGNIITLTAVWQRTPESGLIAFTDLKKYGGQTDTVYTRVATRGKTYGEVYETQDGTKTPAFPIPAKSGYFFDGWANADGEIVTEDTVYTHEGFEYLYARWVKAVSYSDVSSGSLTESVSRAAHYGYMNGTGKGAFSPNANVTRAMAATVIWRMDGSPEYGNNAFFDVDTSSFASQAITWAKENGVFNGRESDTFAPDDYITREALAAVLYRYILDYKNAHLRVTVGVLNGYTDNNEISDSFRDAMIWAVSDGIITGASATRLDPKGYVTRAQAATIAVRMRNLLIEKGIITEYETKGSINYDANKVGYIAPTLEQTSWEQVRAASRAGIADAVWNVGDEKKLYLDSGEVLTAQIYGFNHDDLTDGGKAGITFGLKDIMQDARAMAESASNAGGFASTSMYEYLNGYIYSVMPADLRYNVGAADKKTYAKNGRLLTESMKIFLFSESECFGTVYHSMGQEGEKYEIFTDDESRIKLQPLPDIREWWERSVRAEDDSSYCIVHATGHAGYTSASWPYAGVNFGFCV